MDARRRGRVAGACARGESASESEHAHVRARVGGSARAGRVHVLYYRPPHTGGEDEAEAGRSPAVRGGRISGSKKYTGTRQHSSPFNTGTFHMAPSTTSDVQHRPAP